MSKKTFTLDYLIPRVKLHEDTLAHHVVSLVLPVLVDDAGNVHPVLTQGQQRLLVLVSGQVHREHIGPSNGAGENSTVRVQTFS